jgi:hypothetical protein
VRIASLLAPRGQQGPDCLVNELSSIVTKRSDDLPEDHRFTKCVLRSIVRRELTAQSLTQVLCVPHAVVLPAQGVSSRSPVGLGERRRAV